VPSDFDAETPSTSSVFPVHSTGVFTLDFTIPTDWARAEDGGQTGAPPTLTLNDPTPDMFDIFATGSGNVQGSTGTYRVDQGVDLSDAAVDIGIYDGTDITIRYTDGPETSSPIVGRVHLGDESGASGASRDATDSATFDLRNGVLQSDKSVYLIGRDMILTIIEPDWDLDNDAAETYDLDVIEWPSDAATGTTSPYRSQDVPPEYNYVGLLHGSTDQIVYQTPDGTQVYRDTSVPEDWTYIGLYYGTTDTIVYQTSDGTQVYRDSTNPADIHLGHVNDDLTLSRDPPRFISVPGTASTGEGILTSGSYTYIGFGSDFPVFADQRIRQAVALGIDRDAIGDGAAGTPGGEIAPIDDSTITATGSDGAVSISGNVIKRDFGGPMAVGPGEFITYEVIMPLPGSRTYEALHSGENKRPVDWWSDFIDKQQFTNNIEGPDARTPGSMALGPGEFITYEVHMPSPGSRTYEALHGSENKRPADFVVDDADVSIVGPITIDPSKVIIVEEVPPDIVVDEIRTGMTYNDQNELVRYVDVSTAPAFESPVKVVTYQAFRLNDGTRYQNNYDNTHTIYNSDGSVKLRAAGHVYIADFTDRLAKDQPTFSLGVAADIDAAASDGEITGAELMAIVDADKSSGATDADVKAAVKVKAPASDTKVASVTPSSAEIGFRRARDSLVGLLGDISRGDTSIQLSDPNASTRIAAATSIEDIEEVLKTEISFVRLDEFGNPYNDTYTLDELIDLRERLAQGMSGVDGAMAALLDKLANACDKVKKMFK